MSPTSLARTVLTAALAPTIALAGAGCGDADPGDHTQPTVPVSSRPTTAPSTGGTAAVKEESRMRIQITIGEQRFGATLGESAAARDLVAQLPATVDMIDHGGVEKTGPLRSPLSLAGQPDGADPDVGDVGYYAPGQDLVLYYGDQSYFPGIVILGRLHGDAAGQIASISGSVTATIEAGRAR